jgi:hypothetical protein
MNRRIYSWISAVVVVIALSGCAAAVVKTPGAAPLNIRPEARKNLVLNISGSELSASSKDWQEFRSAWLMAMSIAASASGKTTTSQEEEPKPTGEAGTLVAIHVEKYRYVSANSRAMVGVMTGNAYVESKARFLDLALGTPMGERTYKTTSHTMEGAFSAMTEKQLDAICREIINDIDGK